MTENNISIQFEEHKNHLFLKKYKNHRYIQTNEEWYGNYENDTIMVSIYTDYDDIRMHNGFDIIVSVEGNGDYIMMKYFRYSELSDAIHCYVSMKDFITKEQLVDNGFKEI